MADHLPSADPDRTALREPSELVTLNDSADGTLPRLPDPPEGAPVVPGYRITGEIARGGMGKVYAAHHLTLDREVAIKTLLPGANADRFVTESKITAKLPHPNIPPVYDLGTLADGSPFLAMKLIRGKTLSELLKARPTPQHDLPRWVQVFEQICQAVGFAHSKGVIHRDLKPLNVMVGEFGEVQVMDWGLAKATSRDREGAGDADPAPSRSRLVSGDVTQAGAILGTPGYMAPEQARAEPLDVRADVFALGATLAAVLTGKPAFVGNTPVETVQKAGRADLTDVFARLDACGADADLIATAKRCLAADHDARPADGRAVAAEVGAYRVGVEARLRQAETDRAEAVVRATETRKRQRALIWAGGIIAGVLLAGIVGVLLGLWEAKRQEGEAKRQEGIAKGETAEKEVARQAEEAAKVIAQEQTALAKLETERAFKALRSTTDDVARDLIGEKPVVSPTERKFLQAALARWQEFADHVGDDEQATRIRAEAHGRVSNLLSQLGDKQAAIPNARRSVELWQDVCRRRPDDQFAHRACAVAHGRLGDLFKRTQDLGEAERHLTRAVVIRSELVAGGPQPVEVVQELASGYEGLGQFYVEFGRPDEAVKPLEKAVKFRRRLADDDPDEHRFRVSLATAHRLTAEMHEERNELEEAEKHFRLAVALHAKAPPAAGVRSDWSTERATVHCNFGNLLSARKEWEEAEAQFRLAVAEGERVYADFPNHFINRRDLGVTYGNLSNLYAVRRRWPEAEVTLKKGLTIQEKLVVDFAYIPAMKVDLAATCCNYGMLLNDLGRPTEALPWLDRAVDTLRAVLAKEPRTTNARAFLGNSHWGRATANEYLQRPADALKEWDAALEYSPKKSHPFIRYRRSEALIRLGQTAEAVTEVGQLRKLNDWNATQWYDFACVYAVAADEIADEKQNYADRAMEVLQKAVRAGYKDTAHMKEDKDLDSLRERDDFKKLVAELEKKFPPKREELPAPRADK